METSFVNGKKYYLLQVKELNKIMFIEATQEITDSHVKDYSLIDYFNIDGKSIICPIVKVIQVDSKGEQIDVSPEPVKDNLIKFLSLLAGKGESLEDVPKFDHQDYGLIKVSLHSQLQKQGNRKYQTGSIFDLIENEPIESNREELINKKQEYKIEVVGLDLSKSQEKALFAIQTLLSQTNYRGNDKGRYINSSSMNFQGYLPSVKFTPAEYLELYGVNKYKSGRGYMEFSSGERTEALNALKDLALNRYLIIYERKYWSEKEKGERSDVIRTIRPLINITEGFQSLTEKESDSLREPDSTITNDKLTAIIIEPNPILFDQIDNYFVLKPANCYQEIKLLVGNASKFVYRFVDYLLTEVAQRKRKDKNNPNWVIKINYQTLGTILRMDSYIKTRNWKKMRNTINNCYENAKKLDYLSDYTVNQKGTSKTIDVITLNPDKFNKIDNINRRREEIEKEFRSHQSIIPTEQLDY